MRWSVLSSYITNLYFCGIIICMYIYKQILYQTKIIAKRRKHMCKGNFELYNHYSCILAIFFQIHFCMFSSTKTVMYQVLNIWNMWYLHFCIVNFVFPCTFNNYCLYFILFLFSILKYILYLFQCYSLICCTGISI